MIDVKVSQDGGQTKVELTEELYDWLTSATLDEIVEWLWSLLEQ